MFPDNSVEIGVKHHNTNTKCKPNSVTVIYNSCTFKRVFCRTYLLYVNQQFTKL